MQLVGVGRRRRCAILAAFFLCVVGTLPGCSDSDRSMTEEEWIRAYCAAGKQFNDAIDPYMSPDDEDVPRLLLEYRRATADYAAALRGLAPPSSVGPFHENMVHVFEAGAAVNVSGITETDTGEATAAFWRAAAASVTPPASPAPGVLDRLNQIAARIDDCPPGVFGAAKGTR